MARKAWHYQKLNRVDRHDLKRLDFLGHFHCADLGGDSGTAAANHDHSDQDGSHLAQQREHHQIGNVHFRAESFRENAQPASQASRRR